MFVAELEPFRATLQGVAIESTFNWYWLVDCLRAKKFPAKCDERSVMSATPPLGSCSLLAEAVKRYHWLVHVYTLMTNHF